MQTSNCAWIEPDHKAIQALLLHVHFDVVKTFDANIAIIGNVVLIAKNSTKLLWIGISNSRT